ncbi:prepilin-type N-terminal cleavage/methylation domain-containing protein [bacterium]|nr:prepilin-type N-terminal cleavage/methylation domain-containing protein [bacterium]
MLRKESGFTLIEVLLVIIIIGILAGLAVPAIRGISDQAKLSEVDGDHKTLKTALESYMMRYGVYPASAVYAAQPGNASSVAWQANLTNASPRVLEKVVDDPFALNKGESYYFFQDNDNQNWLMVSVGPDQEIGTDYSLDPDLDNTASQSEKDNKIEIWGDDILISNLSLVNDVDEE